MIKVVVSVVWVHMFREVSIKVCNLEEDVV